ncbi:hypothetical protein T484DRAFT_1764840 [Baffinella frigidus]|nr:hypothetical protein T484DRAFT_1764840 [Cryptophyta sp. CCMP2293]
MSRPPSALALSHRLSQLATLHLVDTCGLTDESINHLATPASLATLHLVDTCGLTDESMSHLALNLSTSLTDLTLSGCRNLRGSFVRQVVASCPALRALALSRCAVPAIALDPISRLQNLEVISVTSCTRTDNT